MSVEPAQDDPGLVSERPLRALRVAFLATDGVEDREVAHVRDALRRAGATVDLLSNKAGSIWGMVDLDRTTSFPVDRRVEPDQAGEFDALVIPGGLKSPDKLRTDPPAVAFVNRFVSDGRPIAAICHGPALLLEAGGVRGRTVTSYPSLRTDVVNAGGTWVNEEVWVDGNLVTSRRPEDIPAFCRAFIEVLCTLTPPRPNAPCRAPGDSSP